MRRLGRGWHPALRRAARPLKVTPGPWEYEPNSERWVDERTGLHCQVIRNLEMGHLCGYVLVQKGLNFETEPYGGVTYGWDSKVHAGMCWVGFDCCHFPDYTGFFGDPPSPWGDRAQYRSFAWVRDHVLTWAAQLHAEGARHG